MKISEVGDFVAESSLYIVSLHLEVALLVGKRDLWAILIVVPSWCDDGFSLEPDGRYTKLPGLIDRCWNKQGARYFYQGKAETREMIRGIFIHLIP